MEKILVVDDEQSLREVLSIMLKRAGYAVTSVSDGEEAIEQLQKEIFDLVITDLRMPKVDGMEVLKAVKSASPETVVLIITAFATADSGQRARRRQGARRRARGSASEGDGPGRRRAARAHAHMRAAAARLKMAPVVLKPTELEAAAAAMVPKPTPKLTAEGYQGYRQFLTGADLTKFRGLDTTEMSRLVNGRHSLLDIKKMLEAQAPVKADLQQIIDYVGVLMKAGLVEMPVPAAKGQKPIRK